MASVLVAGFPGVGKTSLVRELAERRLNAYDADLVKNTLDPHRVPMLGNWFDTEGRLSHMYKSSSEWRAAHKFNWDVPTLQRLVASAQQDEVLYVAGTASNLPDMIQFFDGLIVLDADVETIMRRLRLGSRSTPYPFESDQNFRAQLEANIPGFQAFVRKQGAEIVDARPGIASVADAVIRAAALVLKRGPKRSSGSV